MRKPNAGSETSRYSARILVPPPRTINAHCSLSRTILTRTKATASSCWLLIQTRMLVRI